MSSDSDSDGDNQPIGQIVVTGNKENLYYWKPSGHKKVKIHINGFSDLHREFFRCKSCSGAYQSKTILQKHILKYHYKKSVKVNSQEPRPQSPNPQPSTSSAAKKHKKREKRKKHRVAAPKIYTTSDPSSDSSTADDERVEDSDTSDDESDDSNSNKNGNSRILIPNSDYSDEGEDELSENQMKSWLQKHNTPESKLKLYASRTFELRMRHASDLNIKDFVKIWPRYFHSNGLYDCDFKQKMKKLTNFVDVWPNLSQKIIQHAGGEESIKTTLGVYVHRLTTEQKEIVSLMMLPNIIRSKRKSQPGEYFSASEARDAFFRVVPHDPKRAKQQGLKNVHQAPQQPYILITGKMSALAFESYSVVIDGHVIVYKDFLEAIDCCYKCYWIFNCEFPEETEQIWRALGVLIYSMSEGQLSSKTQKTLNSFWM